MPQNFGTCQTCERSVVDLYGRLARKDERIAELEAALRALVQQAPGSANGNFSADGQRIIQVRHGDLLCAMNLVTK